MSVAKPLNAILDFVQLSKHRRCRHLMTKNLSDETIRSLRWGKASMWRRVELTAHSTFVVAHPINSDLPRPS